MKIFCYIKKDFIDNKNYYAAAVGFLLYGSLMLAGAYALKSKEIDSVLNPDSESKAVLTRIISKDTVVSSHHSLTRVDSINIANLTQNPTQSNTPLIKKHILNLVD